MKTFLKFFSGTTGVIAAVLLCGAFVCLACFLSSGVIISIASTPTP